MKKTSLPATFLLMVVAFLVSLHLTARPGNNCVARCTNQAESFCYEFCDKYGGAGCMRLWCASAYCLGGIPGSSICMNLWYLECTTGRKGSFECALFDPRCYQPWW